VLLSGEASWIDIEGTELLYDDLEEVMVGGSKRKSCSCAAKGVEA
jgi:hypothetical protein